MSASIVLGWRTKTRSIVETVFKEENASRFLLVILGLYAIRYVPVFSERILLWDDFEHLIHNSTWDGFLQYVFGSKLHFIPMLHTAYWALVRFVPLPWIPAVTSIGIGMFMVWYVSVYLRLSRLLGLARVPALFGLTYILLNPMFAESQVWFCVSFYLAGLVVTLEALVQFLTALREGGTFRWVASGLLAMMAPCFWTLGYLVGPLFLLVLWFERKRPFSRRAAGAVVLLAFAFYPALRLIGQAVASHEYGVVPANPWTVLKMVLKMIPDGLILGAMGFWFRLEAAYKYSPYYLNFHVALFLIFLGWLWRRTDKRMAFCIGLFFLFLGFAIPLWGRGNQFAYEVLRFALRYYTFPIFGMAILVSLFAHYCVKENRSALPWLLVLWAVFVVGSFSTKNPEYYTSAVLVEGKIRKLRSAQVAQLSFLEEFFKVAYEEGIAAAELAKHYYFPINGGDFHNGMGIYSGAPASQAMHPHAKQRLDSLLDKSDVWKTYQSILPLTYPPESIFRADSGKGRSLVAEQDLSHAENITTPLKQDSGGSSRDLTVTGRAAVWGFPVKAEVEKVYLDLEVPNHPGYNLNLSYRYADLKSPSLNVNCPQTRCRFQIPNQHLSWFPKAPVNDVLVRVDLPEGARIRVHELSAVP